MLMPYLVLQHSVDKRWPRSDASIRNLFPGREELEFFVCNSKITLHRVELRVNDFVSSLVFFLRFGYLPAIRAKRQFFL